MGRNICSSMGSDDGHTIVFIDFELVGVRRECVDTYCC
jgi:hypothetical protein